MIKTLILLFILLISILTFSAHGTTATPEIQGFRSSKQQKGPNSMILESSKPNAQRTNLGLMSQKSRTVYGGANNVKNPHKVKSSASTNSIKSSSLFMVALSHLIPAMLLVGCFF